MKDFFKKDNYSIFNKCLSTFEETLKIVDEMDEEDDINDSLGTLMENIFPYEDNFDLKKSIIASILFVSIACSLIFFYALFGCIITAIIFLKSPKWDFLFIYITMHYIKHLLKQLFINSINL